MTFYHKAQRTPKHHSDHPYQILSKCPLSKDCQTIDNFLRFLVLIKPEQCNHYYAVMIKAKMKLSLNTGQNFCRWVYFISDVWEFVRWGFCRLAFHVAFRKNWIEIFFEKSHPMAVKNKACSHKTPRLLHIIFLQIKYKS